MKVLAGRLAALELGQLWEGTVGLLHGGLLCHGHLAWSLALELLSCPVLWLRGKGHLAPGLPEQEGTCGTISTITQKMH